MSASTAIGLALALVSTTLVNLAYLREHDAAAALPALSMRRPLHSIGLLLGDRRWLVGFAMETAGFLLYVAALALASLTLVQSVSAGGIGVLAFVSARMSKRELSRRELAGVLASIFGLAALAISLAGGSDDGSGGSTAGAVVWLGATAATALVVLGPGRALFGAAVANGVAGGLMFSIGDVSTKVATEGAAHFGFVLTIVVGYAVGTALLQLGYQAGGALTVAGIATLLTNAVPIAAGAIVLDEPVPSGALGVLRVLAFAAVCAGAFLLARPDAPAPEARPRSAAAGEPAPQPYS
jgi:hypothetical protein